MKYDIPFSFVISCYGDSFHNNDHKGLGFVTFNSIYLFNISCDFGKSLLYSVFGILTVFQYINSIEH